MKACEAWGQASLPIINTLILLKMNVSLSTVYGQTLDRDSRSVKKMSVRIAPKYHVDG